MIRMCSDAMVDSPKRGHLAGPAGFFPSTAPVPAAGAEPFWSAAFVFPLLPRGERRDCGSKILQLLYIVQRLAVRKLLAQWVEVVVIRLGHEHHAADGMGGNKDAAIDLAAALDDH